MNIKCPRSSCLKNETTSLDQKTVVRKGNFRRKSDGQAVPKYFCKECLHYFSSATVTPTYFQKVRRINRELEILLSSRVSQRRAAMILGVNRKTIARRMRYLAKEARLRLEEARLEIEPGTIQHVQFDELETAEHTKCKPLSVALAVEAGTRKILGFQVSLMPARGKLARLSRKKYGKRPDERTKGMDALFTQIAPMLDPNVMLLSDQNPRYPARVKKHFPKATHIAIPGGRGGNFGQGELRTKRFDPMFSLNHTCAMLRANMNRLIRKTWCTTKNIQGLIDHLSIYVAFHNEKLTSPRENSGAS